MRFIRRLSVKHHPTGDHYTLAIPAQVAQAVGLDREDGLISLSVDEGGKVTLQAYRDTEVAWREKFDTVAGDFRGVPVPPNILGRSRPTPCGKVQGYHGIIKETYAALTWCRTRMKLFPKRRR